MIQVCEEWCGRGLITGVLDVLEEWLRDGEAGCSALYVQNIVNPRLAQFLARRGWSCPGGCEPGECMACMRQQLG